MSQAAILPRLELAGQVCQLFVEHPAVLAVVHRHIHQVNPTLGQQLLQHMRDRNREGTTFLFIEHDMEVVARYAERVVAFYDGGVLADGSPDQVLADENVRTHVVGPELHRAGA